MALKDTLSIAKLACTTVDNFCLVLVIPKRYIVYSKKFEEISGHERKNHPVMQTELPWQNEEWNLLKREN